MSRPLSLIAIALPALLGLALALGMETGAIPITFLVLRLQVSAGLIAAIIGLALTLPALAFWAARWWWKRRLTSVIREERRAQVEARRRFVQRLNHELKNPLTAIRAGLVNVAPVSSERSLATIDRQVERLGRLADDLRKLADLETRQLEREPVDLAALIEEAVEVARAVPGREGRTVAIQVQRIPWQLSPAQGDGDLLLLAVYNLIDNALKFTSRDAAVEVRATEGQGQVTVAVVDTGCGIPAEELGNITEELYRGTHAQGIEGSGLGLALVERIARLHGGELDIRSREGHGTVVEMRLPLARG